MKTKAKGKFRVNQQIDVQTVRLINDKGEQLGIISLNEALTHAEQAKLDLVEIAPDAEPVVCKIMDYNKHLFDIKKERALHRKKQKQSQVKEIKFRPSTEEGDYQVKLRNITRFLSDGDKAKVSLRFKGRELAHQELGMELLLRLKQDLEDNCTVETEPKMEGRQMIMIVAPKKK